jgi:phosphoglycerate dehydrogenase-like enzyme
LRAIVARLTPVQYPSQPAMAYRIFCDLAGPEDALQALKAGTKGHELLFPTKPAVSCLHKADPDPLMSLADIIVGQPDPEAVANAPAVKWIQISSSSITRYDDPGFRTLVTSRKIAVCNSASVYSEACAEHALAFMLAQARLLPHSLRTRAAGGTQIWNELREASIPLSGQSVLIVGYGAIGKRLTELLTPLSMRVMAHRRAPRDDDGVDMIELRHLPRALAAADHVIDILPDSAQTHHFFNAARFGNMKLGSVFYNIGRGTTVDQDALLAVLRTEHLRAAWLDVTDPEPLPDDDPLLAQRNCYITPHVAGGHAHESVTFVRHFLANLSRFERGEPLRDRVM